MEVVMIILGVINLALLAYLLVNLNKKETEVDFSEITEKLVKTDTKVEILSKKIDELQPKIASEFRENRKEISGNLGEIQKTVDTKITRLQDSNEKKLEQMRETVDEKLKESVEKRFNESFKTISGQLTQVYQGLGEMKNLATGVGDLKKVMEGVKTRGIYGEVQLGAIIEDILPDNQYLMNVATKSKSLDKVEYAIKIPSKGMEALLPIDSKFPVENYQRLLKAYDDGDKSAIELWRKALRRDVVAQAKKIQEKYIDVPKTTEIGMMFLPTESLYAEIIRIPGLAEEVRQKYSISISSPVTLPVMLTGLKAAYSKVKLEKRTADIWKLLGGVKTGFGKFGDLLDGVERKLNESAKKVGEAKKEAGRMVDRLDGVESLPESETSAVLESGA